MNFKVLKNDPRDFRTFDGKKIFNKRHICIRLTNDKIHHPYFSALYSKEFTFNFMKLKYIDIYTKYDIGGISYGAYNDISKLAEIPEFNFGNTIFIDDDNHYPVTFYNKYVFIDSDGKAYFTIVGGNCSNLLPFEVGEKNPYSSYIDLKHCSNPISMTISSERKNCTHRNSCILRGTEQFSRKTEYQWFCKDCGKQFFFNKNTIETLNIIKRIFKLTDKLDNYELHRIMLNAGTPSQFTSIDKCIERVKNNVDKDYLENMDTILANYSDAPKATNKW